MALRRSYVASIPNEVFLAIFEAGSIAPEERLQFAMPVSQVSRLWRKIAIHTPFMWSSIQLLGKCGKGWLKLIKLMITLSRFHLLEVDIKCDYEAVDVDILQFQVDIILPEVFRWKRIYYSGRYEDDHHHFLFVEPLSQLSAPLLEVFEIDIFAEDSIAQVFLDDNETIDNATGIFAGGAPMLQKVRVNGIRITWCLPPLLSVTSLEISYPPDPINFAIFKAILTSPSALTHLDLDGDVVIEDQLYQPGRSINLSSLRSLWITAGTFPSSQLLNLLSILRCPGLETLRIVSSFNDGPGHQPDPNIELPMFSSLRSLELEDLNCTHLSVCFDVTKLPALRHITFCACLSATALLSILVVQNDIATWPLLRDISLDMVSLRHLDIEDLCKVLSYRIKCGKPIQCVKLSTHPTPDDNRVDRLREHVQVEISTLPVSPCTQ